jgi:hypothetical protein
MLPAISLLTHYKVAVCLEVRDLLHYPWTTPHLFVYPYPSRLCRTFHQSGTNAMHRYLLGIVFLLETLLRMLLMHLYLLLAKVAAPFPYSHDISMIGREHWLMPCRRSTSIRNRHLDRHP